MTTDRKGLDAGQLTELYRQLLYPRLIEEKMLVFLRQGKISKWFSGIGQEAIAVGATRAMQPDEWIMPLHRNLGVFTARNMPLSQLFMQWQGMQEGYSKGRERSFHFGSTAHHICGMISHLGPQLAVADGVALAYRLDDVPRVALAFSGEGGTSEGDFHEALNIAAVWDLPVIFLVENNGYALSTPVQEQFRCISLADKARGYGMEGVTIDGNDLLTVYDTIKGVREYCLRYKKPYLVECMTFRMRGHEEASGTKYVPEELFALWAQKDPVKQYEEFLLSEQLITEEEINETRQLLKQQVEQELEAADKGSLLVIDTAEELRSVYAEPAAAAIPVTAGMPVTEKRFVEAVRDGLHQCLEKNENLVLMGQDIAEYGGAFKVTEGLLAVFGKDRIRNTPICESAVVGAALGLSLEGKKAVVEMQFADFVSVGFNQIVNNLAKIHYRWGQSADVVIRMPTGGGVGAGPFHSQSNEAWFMHTPGLKVVYPATPADAKGLLIAAINDPNPVLFFEHKALYRSSSGPVPDGMYTVEIGKARTVCKGEDITIITYGMGVVWAEEYAAAHPEISLEILDLRSLLPLDYDAIRASVKRTGKVLVLHEDTLTAGTGAEIAAWIGEHCFNMLDAPVLRCASLDTPVPFNKELEQNFLAKKRLDQCIEELMNY
ncbi:alpha-ketoacid dehydrogenase subunit alpha/beta [Niabella beijingensis]|uniref:alpha-ketoacid dehydrogenase subunit alpha/beta n=1 Tax=Niabella beijingensis TaxID=2872700 RepID=UPI001CBE04D6|nr:dehydrogenase E1 component subunit alpha/beta [Niabella beijingensis]MBZ4189085.1 dehydrogenase E1 component subunit alpha/beta [Niabella beijingensis]